jgi:hypothetical protein
MVTRVRGSGEKGKKGKGEIGEEGNRKRGGGME